MTCGTLSHFLHTHSLFASSLVPERLPWNDDHVLLQCSPSDEKQHEAFPILLLLLFSGNHIITFLSSSVAQARRSPHSRNPYPPLHLLRAAHGPTSRQRVFPSPRCCRRRHHFPIPNATFHSSIIRPGVQFRKGRSHSTNTQHESCFLGFDGK